MSSSHRPLHAPRCRGAVLASVAALAFFTAALPLADAQGAASLTATAAVCRGGIIYVDVSCAPQETGWVCASRVAFTPDVHGWELGQAAVNIGTFQGPTTLAYAVGSDAVLGTIYFQAIVAYPDDYCTARVDSAIISVSLTATYPKGNVAHAKTPWPFINRKYPGTDMIKLRVTTTPAGYEQEVDLAIANPVPGRDGTLTRVDADDWDYTAFPEPAVLQGFQLGRVHIQPSVGGSSCSPQKVLTVVSVFEYLINPAILDYAMAWQWVWYVRHPWLQTFRLPDGSITGFSRVTFVSTPTVTRGLHTGIAVTNPRDLSVVFAAQAFIDEWALASTTLHELVHTGQPAYSPWWSNANEFQAYSIEVAWAGVTGILQWSIDYYLSTVEKRDALE